MVKYNLDEVRKIIASNLKLDQDFVNEIHLMMGGSSTGNDNPRKKFMSLIDDEFLNNFYDDLASLYNKSEQ